MITKEIRRKVQDNKGKSHDKLVCMTLTKEENIYISIKDRSFFEPVLINIFDILEPYVDEKVIKEVQDKVGKAYKKFKNKAS